MKSTLIAKAQNTVLAFLLTASGAAVAPISEARAEATQAKETWRATVPTLPSPKRFKMPDVVKYQLENGLEVQLVEDHRVPYVTTFLGMKSGTILDDRDKLGVAELTADMLTEGTKTRKSKDISEEIDFIGGTLHAVSDYDFTFVTGSCLSNYTDKLFNLFSDVLLNPSFPENELSLKKTNWIQELTMKRSDPDFLSQERFRKVIFGSHPYGVVSPKPEMIGKITTDDLKKHHQTYFIPNDSVFLVIGDFEVAQMKALIASSLAGWQKGERKSKELPSVAQHKDRRIYLVDRPGSAQSSLVLGNLGIKRTDPDIFAIKVMNQILGGSAHSRLFLNIREQKGYTYGAYSSFDARVYPDAFSASADVRPEVTGPSLKEFIYELEKMRDSSVTEEELKDAKNYTIGQFQLQLETQSGLAHRLLDCSMYNLPKDYLETYADKVMAVTPADVQKAAQKIIQANDLVITVVGDAAKIKSDLEKYGKIEVYETSGELSSESNPTKGPDS